MKQRWDPETYAEHGRFVSDLGAPVSDLLDPQRGERILDLGCGDGALTERLREAGCSVVAVDSSPEQVCAALQRGLDARIIDAEELPFDAEFDAVFSNAVLHWVRDVDSVLRGVHRSLKSGGRFVGEFGAAGNVAAIRKVLGAALGERGIDSTAVDPWYFPTPAQFRLRLEHNGFEVASIQHFARPTPLAGDITHWIDVFAQPFLAAVPAAARPGLMRDVRTRLEPRLRTAGDVWVVDYVRLRFTAVRPYLTNE